ncbi:MAG: hypothetical protein WC934_14815 [Acidithiobacillus sp.]|jgi:ribosomal protein L22|uniref:hypothetical protein n=1 Tax=Acidithiobacillus sp. TaxID=1872118 RepID=UPI00356112E6
MRTVTFKEMSKNTLINFAKQHKIIVNEALSRNKIAKIVNTYMKNLGKNNEKNEIEKELKSVLPGMEKEIHKMLN